MKSRICLIILCCIGLLGINYNNAKETITHIFYDTTNKINFNLNGNTFEASTITISQKNNSINNTITILDRNLGATSDDITKLTSFGYHYQWGNNHGFTRVSNGSNEFTLDDETIESEEYADTSENGPDNPYYSPVFITDPYETNNQGWDKPPYNSNLRGGSGDSEENNRGYDTENHIAINVIGRKGPCPEGYHVPTKKERENLIFMYYSLNPSGDLNEYSLGYEIFDNKFTENFRNAFKIPLAGHRYPTNSAKVSFSSDTSLRSSSPNHNSKPLSSELYITTNAAGNQLSTAYSQYRGVAQSVRCFRNEPIDVSTIQHENKIITFDVNDPIPNSRDESRKIGYFGGDSDKTSKQITYTRSEESWTYIPNEQIEIPQREGFIFSGWYIYDEDYRETHHYAPWNGIVTDDTPSEQTIYAHREKATGLSSGFITEIDAPGAEGYRGLKFDDGNGHIIMLLDRNLGATTTGAGTNASTESYGYTYQWGNNHGFKDSDEQDDIITNTKAMYSKYYDNSNFYGDKFISTSSQYGYDYRSDSNYSSQNHPNLRGGGNDTKNNLRGLTSMTEKNIKNRRGPCPEGYHVPSIGERNALLTYRGFAFNNMYQHVAGNLFYSTVGIHGLEHEYNNIAFEFADAFNIPYAGYRPGSNGNANYMAQHYGYLWSSSPHIDEKDGGPSSEQHFARHIRMFNRGNATDFEGSRRANGFPVRCFYDSYLFPYHYSLMNGNQELLSGNVKLNDKLINIIDESIIGEGNKYEYRYIKNGNSSIPYDFSSEVTSDLTLIAKNPTPIEEPHILTIKYICEECNENIPTTTQTLISGAEYSIPSPILSGYTPDRETVTGIMPDSDYTETVIYTKNPDYGDDIGGESENTYTLTINYIYNNNGTTAAPSYSGNFTGGAPYSIESPTIAGYTPDQDIVSGDMPNFDKTITVIYSKNIETPQTYTLTINYKYSDGGQASPSVIKNLIAGESYSITSPNISNYTASTSIVKGTMPNENITISIIYTQNSSGGGGGGGGSSVSNNSSSNQIYLKTNNKYPSINEYINLKIETDDDYTNRLTLYAKYKNAASSSWSTISNTSSTYFSDYSSEWKNGYYKMKSSDDGKVIIDDLVQFKKSGYYRIYVEDTYGNESYIQFTVNNKINSDISISTSPSNPDTNEWINLVITTDNDYNNEIIFSKFQYKSPNSSSWSTISRSSSSYISDYSSVWSKGYYKMTTSDNGKTTLKNLIKFSKDGYYRIYVEDIDRNESYVQINVESPENKTTQDTKTTRDEYDIEELIKNLLNMTGNSNNTDSSNNTQLQNTHSSAYETNNIIESIQSTGLTQGSEIYISRSCKPYTIQYIESLNAYTSPDLKKSEYFVNKEYFKRYIDSKNAQNAECYINDRSRIQINYNDTYTGEDRITAPNGKIYFIDQQNNGYSSKQLSSAKSFSTINEMKSFIKNHNPLSKIQ